MARQVQVVNDFSYMNFVGPIALRDPHCEIGVFEEYPPGGDPPNGTELMMIHLWMGLKVSLELLGGVVGERLKGEADEMGFTDL